MAIAIEYDLHCASHDHQHSKISSLESSQRIPYPLDKEKNLARRYESNFNRRLFDEDADDRVSDRVRTFHQVNRSVDSHPMTRNTAIHDITSTLNRHRLAGRSPDFQPPAPLQQPTPVTNNISHKAFSRDDPPNASSATKSKPTPSTPGAPPNQHPAPGPANTHDPTDPPSYPAIPERHTDPTQALGAASLPTDNNKTPSAKESAVPELVVADQSAVPPGTQPAPPDTADTTGQPDSMLEQVLTQMTNLDKFKVKGKKSRVICKIPH